MMRRLFLRLGSATVALLLSATPGHACGDKLIALNRGLRFQDFSSSRRASILMYSHIGFSPAALRDFTMNGIDGAWVDTGTKARWRTEWSRELDTLLPRPA